MYPRPLLKKGKIVLLDKKAPNISLSNPKHLSCAKELEFQFNPKEISLSRTMSVSAGERDEDSYYAPIKVDGTSTIDELSFELVLDHSAISLSNPATMSSAFLPVTSAEIPLTLLPAPLIPMMGIPSVQDSITILYSWTMIVNPGEVKENRPYFVMFEWDDFKFSGAISKLDFKYTLFDSDGTPLRAKVDISLKGRLGKWAVQDLAVKKKSTKTTKFPPG
jgi:hypothetical protein